jgi:glycosyltransferase involved in cell wall biosynthesis
MTTRYVFLTACRNEAAILDEFLSEFAQMVRAADIGGKTVLYVVDDLSTDASPELIEAHAAVAEGYRVELIRAPTNLGNQGALFYGIGRISIEPDDVLITFDCDGEDDVREIPSILALGRENPGKLVLIERGRRRESLAFRVSFVCYKVLYRFLTRQTVIPNNFLLIPGRYVPIIRRSPLAAAHFAYGILRTKFPAVMTQRDRRTRYGGRSSQSLFMLASHGLVGLMVFYETVIAKLLLVVVQLGLFGLAVVAAALIPVLSLSAQRILLWLSMVALGMGVGFFGLLMASALALIFKMGVFSLSRAVVEGQPAERRDDATAVGSQKP